MRIVRLLVVVPALALLAMSCGPRPLCPYAAGAPCKGRAEMAKMMHGCGPESCTYKSRCFSSGAIRSNDGVCQECGGGKWVSATGCREDGCGKHAPPCALPCNCPHARR